MLFDQADLDPASMNNAWTGMAARARQLSSKVQDTWNDKVEPAFEEADAPSELVDQQRARADALCDEIEVATEQTRIAIWCDAARKVWARAEAEAPKELACSQCGASIPAPRVLMSVNVTCQHCQSVNTFEPGPRARMIEHFCAHPLSEEIAWPQWLAMRQAEQRLHTARNPKLEHFKGYEQAQIDYWRSYLQARAQMVPRYQASFDADLRGKMAYFYDRIEHEKAWAEAGRPRAL